ncbi:hypothetical protein C8R44DRAFT_629898, partial [Mycena epipterygia]
DAGYTYIDPTTGESYPLTPQMMKVWCRAMVCETHDGLADRNNPPEHLGIFDKANRKVALHPSRIAAGANQKGPDNANNSSDLGHLATIITALTGRNNVDQPLIPSTPKHNDRDREIATANSPVVPTPSKLPRYLDHASKNLGVTTALNFESPMRQNGYGPDILHLLAAEALVELGMTRGDALRLKAGAQDWWKGPNAKRKREDVASEQEADNSTHTPPSKKMAFELCYPNGGGWQRFYGPRMVAAESQSENDRSTWYRCSTTNEWYPVPLGYRAVQEFEYTDDGDGDEGFPSLGPVAPPGLTLYDEDAAAEALALLRNGPA